MPPTASGVGRDITVIIWNVSLLSLSICKFYFNQTEAVNKLLIYMFLTTLTALSLSCVARLASHFTIHEIEYANYILFIIANTSGYLLVLLRLRISFIGSQLSISAKKIYFHILLLIIATSCTITGYILDYLMFFPWDGSVWAFMIVILIIGYCHLTYCFNHNLFLLVLIEKTTMTQIDINKNNVDLNMQQKTILQTVVKQTLLSCVMLAIILCHLVILIIIICVYSQMDENESRKLLLDLVSWSTAFVYNGASSCLYLTFSVNAECYNKICSKCHIRCDHHCQSIAANRMNVKL